LVIESNIFGGLILNVGSVDGASTAKIDQGHVENNWRDFDPTAISWRNAAVIGNNMLLETAGVPIDLNDDSDNAISDFGAQIILNSSETGTQVGPTFCRFNTVNMSLSQGSKQKAISANQCFDVVFNDCSWNGGDTTTDNIVRTGKVNAGTDNQANALRFIDCRGPLPSDLAGDLGNRAFVSVVETSDPGGGGTTYLLGRVRGVGGTLLLPEVDALEDNKRLLDQYLEGTDSSNLFVPTMSALAGGTVALSGTSLLTAIKIGSQVTITGSIGIDSVSAPVGEISIDGLPYAAGAGNQYFSTGSVWVNGQESTGQYILAKIEPGNSKIQLNKIVSGQAADINADLKSGQQIVVSICYFTDFTEAS